MVDALVTWWRGSALSAVAAPVLLPPLVLAVGASAEAVLLTLLGSAVAGLASAAVLSLGCPREERERAGSGIPAPPRQPARAAA